MSQYYPIFIDIRNKLVIVIGNEKPKPLKTLALLDYGAKIVLISTSISSIVKEAVDKGQIQWLKRDYTKGDLKKAFLVIMADTSDEPRNQSVFAEAEANNIPINTIDYTDLCSWISPAVATKGDVTIAISTNGKSPALARRFREELDKTSTIKTNFDLMDLADIVPLASDARTELKNKGLRVSNEHWQASLKDELIELVKNKEYTKAKKILMSDLLLGTSCECPPQTCKLFPVDTNS